MKAREALNLALKAKKAAEDSKERYVKEIFKCIDDASGKGETSLTMESVHDSYVLSRLREEGFKVTGGHQYNEAYLVIDWSDA